MTSAAFPEGLLAVAGVGLATGLSLQGQTCQEAGGGRGRRRALAPAPQGSGVSGPHGGCWVILGMSARSWDPRGMNGESLVVKLGPSEAEGEGK